MNNYLKYLITEDIYIVREGHEKAKPDTEKDPVSSDMQLQNLLNKTLVFIQSGQDDTFSDQDQQLLTKILQAVGEDPDDTLLFDLRDPGPHQDPLSNFRIHDCRILGFLDQLPEQVNNIFPEQKYLVRQSGNFVSLMADPLGLIDSDRTKKKLLWEKLRDMFNLRD